MYPLDKMTIPDTCVTKNVTSIIREPPPPSVKVTVCIANYNGAEVIDACLQAVLAQTTAFPVEIIVHDDASSDGSGQHIREHYPSVRLIESTNNVGFCIANNRMVAAAQGEYVLLLNNDAELFPDALHMLLHAAEESAQPTILGLPQYNATNGELIDRGSLFDPFLNPYPNRDPLRTDVGMLIGACLWLPRPLWQAIGGFPEWFGSMAEDMYVCLVARLWGYPVQVLPHSGFRHWVGHSFGGGKITSEGRLHTSFKRRALSERNKTYVLCLSYPSPWLWPMLLLHLLLLFLEGGILSLVRRDRQIWQRIYTPCFAAIWQDRRRWLHLRRSIQAQRRVGMRRFFRPFSLMPHKLRMLLRHGWPTLG